MKNNKEFSLDGQEFIELNKLLKLLGLVETGGDANLAIEAGKVKVDGQVEYRKRNKLRSGTTVIFKEYTIQVR